MERPVAWVYVTAVNRLHDEFRRSQRSLPAYRGPSDAETRNDETDRLLTAVDLRAALDTLPPRQRLAIVLRYLADLSNDDVARAMQCSVGTVKSTINAALVHLRVDQGGS